MFCLVKQNGEPGSRKFLSDGEEIICDHNIKEMVPAHHFPIVQSAAMFCEHTKPRAGIEKFPSDDEEIFVITNVKKIPTAGDF